MNIKKIGIILDIGEAPRGPKPYRERCSPEEKVERAMELIDSGHESKDEWDFIRAVNNVLVREYQEGRISGRALSILKKIQPIIEKYGMMDPRGVEQDASLHTTTQGSDTGSK